MWLDILSLLVLISAVLKGIRRGLLNALFSFAGLFIGLAAALKLSARLAVYLRESGNVGVKWAPVLAFLLVFVGVIFLVRWLASMIESALQFSMLDWINRLGGVILFIILDFLLFSVLLFYADKMGLIGEDTKASSRSYALLSPLGPSVMEFVGELIPLFKNMFQQLEEFFEDAGKRIPNERSQAYLFHDDRLR